MDRTSIKSFGVCIPSLYYPNSDFNNRNDDLKHGRWRIVNLPFAIIHLTPFAIIHLTPFAIIHLTPFAIIHLTPFAIIHLTPFAIIHLTPFAITIRYNTFDAISLTSEFCCALSSIVTYANVPTVSAHKTNEQLQATSRGQFCLLSCSDVKKS